MKNSQLIVGLLALFLGLWGCSDPETTDRCRNGELGADFCCQSDPEAYNDLCCDVGSPLCSANNVNNTNNVNNSNNSNNSNNVNNVNNVACDPMCSGETPVCDEGTCVECAGNDDCADGICNANGACVACVESTDCPAEAPICFGAGESAACIECAGNNDCTDGVCDTTNNVCVGCFGDGDCADDEVCDTTNNVCVGCVDNNDCTDGVCDTSQSVCVACLESSDCTEADASVCDTSGAAPVCVGCQSEADCSGIAGANHCIAEVCVDCKIESEAADCNGNFCGTDNQCTSTAIGTGTSCDMCGADSDCAANHRCLAIDYKGSPAGSFCFELRPMGMQCDPVTFGTPLSNRTSLGGLTGDFCGINETQTTCGAVKNVGTTCGTDDSVCEVAGGDGLCVLTSCTIPCSRDRECSATCNTAMNYCD